MKPSKNIAVVGRPNVGKSSLFNALLGYRRTIVLDQPGTTMDIVRERVKWNSALRLLDSQGIFDEGDEKVLSALLPSADAVVFVVDAQSGPTPFDRWIAKIILKTRKPVLLVVNKIDVSKAFDAVDFADLGFGEIVEVSVAHRRNLDAVKEWCGMIAADAISAEPSEPEKPCTLALIGRPNSGKSTLMNRLCKEEVSRVSPIPHTTRDPVSFELETANGIIKLVDTAGVRRPRSQKDDLETYSVQASTRAIIYADVVLLLINCSEPITDQDMRLLNLITREGKPAAVLLNFWDMLNAKERKHFLEDSDFGQYLSQFKTVPISGLTGWNVGEILPLAHRLHKQANKRIKTSRLNEIVDRIVQKNPPPTRGRQNFNILYASQVRVDPPGFVFFLNRKGALPLSYRKYLENGLRKALNLRSQPIRVYFRGEKAARS